MVCVAEAARNAASHSMDYYNKLPPCLLGNRKKPDGYMYVLNKNTRKWSNSSSQLIVRKKIKPLQISKVTLGIKLEVIKTRAEAL